MSVPALSRDQRERIGKLIWAHVDGVAENVEHLIRAINTDSLAGIRVVAADEWDRCQRAAKQLQTLLLAMEDHATREIMDSMRSRLHSLTGPF